MSRRLLLPLILAISIMGYGECFGQHEAKQPTLRPRLAECTLSVAGATLKPVRVIESWRYQYPAGAMSISIEGHTVIACDAKTGRTAWKVPSEDGCSLEWLAADERIAYFRAAKMEKENAPRYEQPTRIRRLQLRDHQWLTPLEVGKEKPKEKTTEVVATLLAYKRCLIVLTTTMVDDPRTFEQAGAKLSCHGLRERERHCGLVAKLSFGRQSQSSRHYLMASHRPDYASESIQSLTVVGAKVLVCAGPLEDMICLEPQSGKECWRVPRVWEFRRGFIGPSVWTHYIGRYGIEGNHLDLEKVLKQLEKKSEKGDRVASAYLEQFKDAKARVDIEENAIIAGPVVVPAGNRRNDEPQYSIFVAVARSEKSPWAGYLGDCVVYELSESGNPIGIVTLPRTVNGWQSSPTSKECFGPVRGTHSLS